MFTDSRVRSAGFGGKRISLSVRIGVCVLVCVFNGLVVAQDPISLQRRVVPLPGYVSDIDVGGDGRFIVFRWSDRRQLAVFDVTSESVSFTVPLVEEQVRFAAGKESLIVVGTGSRLLQRWNLQTGERELETLFPIAGIIKEIESGASTQSGMIVFHADGIYELDEARYSLLNPRSLAVTRLVGQFRDARNRDRIHIRPSADGRCFGIWATSHSPSGISSIRLDGDQVAIHYLHESAGHVVPDSDGRYLFTGAGIYTSDIQSTPFRRVKACIPAVTGSLFVALEAPMLKIRSGDRVVAIVEESALLGKPLPKEIWIASDLTLDKRVMLLPRWNRLVVLPYEPQNVLEVYELPGELLRQSVGPLDVTSTPPLEAKKGTGFRHRIVTNVSAATVKFRLLRAPDGMTVSADGELSWPVPKDHPRISELVKLVLADQHGETLPYGFVMRIVD